MAAWELWERAMVPSLLSGAGTWVGCSSEEEEMCDKLQDLFWRVILRVPESCPRIALRAETKMVGMKQRIWQMKILLLKRMKKQGRTSLCGQVLDEQRKNNWPGLTKEVTEICSELDILDVNTHDVPDGQIKKAVFGHHYNQIKEEIAKSKKMEKYKDDDFQDVQPYMKGKSVDNIRMCFRVRCEMVNDIKGNFKSKYTRHGGEAALVCDNCDLSVNETQAHCLVCTRWETIRLGLDLTKIDDLATFFQRLLMERGKKKDGSDGAAQQDSGDS